MTTADSAMTDESSDNVQGRQDHGGGILVGDVDGPVISAWLTALRDLTRTVDVGELANLSGPIIKTLIETRAAEKAATIEAEAVARTKRAEDELERLRIDLEAAKAQGSIDLEAAKAQRSDALMQRQEQVLNFRARVGDMLRGLVLLLVVAAIVGMAWWGLAARIPPELFTQYTAPIIGIAGTVIGYYFGQQAPLKQGTDGLVISGTNGRGEDSKGAKQ